MNKNVDKFLSDHNKASQLKTCALYLCFKEQKPLLCLEILLQIKRLSSNSENYLPAQNGAFASFRTNNLVHQL